MAMLTITSISPITLVNVRRGAHANDQRDKNPNGRHHKGREADGGGGLEAEDDDAECLDGDSLC